MHTQALRYMLILIIIASTSCDAATYTVVNGNTYLNVPGGAAYQLFPEGGGVSGFSNSTAAINALKAVLSSNCSGAGGSANGFLETGSSVNPTYQWVSVICTPPIGEALRSYIGAGGVGGTCPGAVFFPMLSSLEFTACGVFVICDAINPVNGQCEPSCQPPKTINPATGQCEPPETYTITLSGGTEVEPSKGLNKKSLPITATVKDQSTGQPPTNSVQVHISLKVDSTSGGHDHVDSNRPRGSIEDTECVSDNECWPGTSGDNGNTDGSGQVTFNFKAPEASGTHTITVTCDGCSNTATKSVDVKVDGLFPIPSSAFLYSIQLPNRDTNHPDAYYLTKASIEKLQKVALYYYAFTYKLPKNGGAPDFVLNDASLEWGGVLDCFLTCNSAMYPSTPWHKHHIEHRRGTVVDVKANGSPGTIVYDRVFRRWAKKFGVQVGNLHGRGSSLHYHLRFNDGARE